MSPERVAEILLVRAAEEAAATPVSPEARIDALEAAGDLDDERAWFGRRAAYLLAHDLAAFRPLLGVRDAFAPHLGWNLALPFLLGLASNSLGPRSQIHVLYNPIVFLVVWNLAVYAVLLARAGRSRGGRSSRRRGTPRASGMPAVAPGGVASPVRAASFEGGGWLGRLLWRRAARLWLRVHRSAASTQESALDWSAVGARFVTLWDRAARPWFALRLQWILHVAALALALGAIAGMYVRGLFFEYDMVWRSTFVRDPESVTTLLRLFLAPACLLLRRPFPGAEDAEALLSPAGVGAAPWIHLHAATALLAVVVPRALLALSAERRLRRLGRTLTLGLGDLYFAAILQEARAIQVSLVKEKIQDAVRKECARFADDLAQFVAEGLYDGRIAPQLERYRAQGGRIVDLEASVRAECAGFEAELAHHLEGAGRRLEADLTREVLARIGRSLALPSASADRLGATVVEIPGRSVAHVGSALASRFTLDFSAAVALAVAAVSGTLSGGFGTHLGAALLVTLLHTTGPLGFLLGALAGALVAAAALFAGRGQVRGTVRGLRLPSFVVRLALPRGRFERIVAEGRERCLSAVRELVATRLDPLTSDLADQVWIRVKPLLAEAGLEPAPLQPEGG